MNLYPTITIKGKKINLLKIESIREPNTHPFGIEKGYKVCGIAQNDIIVGDFFFIKDVFRTTYVLEIIDENTFKTKNSIYKIEIIEDKNDEDILEKELLSELNEIAMDFDHYDFGLPLHIDDSQTNNHYSQMISAIKIYLEKKTKC